MKKSLVLILAVSCTVAALVFNAVSKPKPEEKEVKQLSQYMYNAMWWQGKYPPDFVLPLLDGTQFRLSEQIGGKVIVLNFFTTWCEPCKEEMPELSAYYTKHKADTLVLIGINVNEKKDLVQQFMHDQEIPFPVGIDEDNTIAEQFGVKSFPTTIVVGVDGKIIIYETGAIANAEVVLDPILRQNKEMLRHHNGIDSMAYIHGLANQPKQDTFEPEPRNEKILLDGEALKFAQRMRCPSCGKSLMKCTCNFCEDIQRKLKAIDIKDKSDEQILRELFLTGDHK